MVIKLGAWTQYPVIFPQNDTYSGSGKKTNMMCPTIWKKVSSDWLYVIIPVFSYPILLSVFSQTQSFFSPIYDFSFVVKLD